MIATVIAALLLLVAVLAFIYGIATKYIEGLITGAVAGLVGLVVIGFASTVIVPTRQVGIPVSFGVTGQPMPNGFNFKAPWTDVEFMSMVPQPLDASEKNPTLAKDVDNMDVFVHNNVRWVIKEQHFDEVFNAIKDSNKDNMLDVSDRFIQPIHRAAIAEVMAKYNPLELEKSQGGNKPTYTEVANEVKQIMTNKIKERGDWFDIISVDVTLIDVTQATKDRINMLNAERANTRIAEQKVKTATNEAEANKRISDSIKNDPNVLVSKCLDAVNEGKALPAGFQCWPATGGSVVLPAGK